MNALFALSLLLLANAPAAGSQTGDGASLDLFVGAQRVLDVPGITRVAGGSSCIDMKPLGAKQLLVMGTAECRTTLIIWKQDGSRQSFSVSVRRPEYLDDYESVRALLADSPDATVRIFGESIFVDGYLASGDDFRRLATFPKIKVFAKLDPGVVHRRIASINSALTRAGLVEVHARLVGSKLLLEGAVNDPAERAQAEQLASALIADLLPYL